MSNVKTVKEIRTFEQILSEDFGIHFEGKEGNDFHSKFWQNLKDAANIHTSQFIDLAAEEAETGTEETYAGNLGNADGMMYDKIKVVDKDSILKLKEQLK